VSHLVVTHLHLLQNISRDIIVTLTLLRRKSRTMSRLTGSTRRLLMTPTTTVLHDTSIRPNSPRY